MSLWYSVMDDQLGLLEGDTLYILAGLGIDVIYKIKPAKTTGEADFVYIGEFE
jgi:hypothetical protein